MVLRCKTGRAGEREGPYRRTFVCTRKSGDHQPLQPSTLSDFYKAGTEFWSSGTFCSFDLQRELLSQQNPKPAITPNYSGPKKGGERRGKKQNLLAGLVPSSDQLGVLNMGPFSLGRYWLRLTLQAVK